MPLGYSQGLWLLPISIFRRYAWLIERQSGCVRGVSVGAAAAFAAMHAALWTGILIILKWNQDVHMDTAEAFAWGQRFLLGYGKHPPLSGWIAGGWFTIFPASDWAAHLLAMSTVSCGLFICWLIARRGMSGNHAMLALVALALCPVFNIKGYKYNADLLQLVTLPLLVLAYLNAFEKRTAFSGLLLGMAACVALLTKYWALTMIGAIAVAAISHPERSVFWFSRAPWIALLTATVLLVPHLLWLKQVSYAPLIYAGDVYAMVGHADVAKSVAAYSIHNVAMAAVPVVFILAVTFGESFHSCCYSRNEGLSLALIQAVVALGPPAGALIFAIVMKADWGIPLFFLVPACSMIAIRPAVQLQTLYKGSAVYLVCSFATLFVSFLLLGWQLRFPNSGSAVYGSRSTLAQQLTQEWHRRFATSWPIAVGTTEMVEHMAFYSSDHPTPIVAGEMWDSGLTSISDAKARGFIGLCDPTDPRVDTCRKWMEENAHDAERIVVRTSRRFLGVSGPESDWEVFIVHSAATARPQSRG